MGDGASHGARDKKDTGFLHIRADELMKDKDVGSKTIRQDFELAPNHEAIIAECDAIKHLLLEKNKSYGDAALNPLRVFSKMDSVEQIKVRIDDKLSRIARGSEYLNEDTVQDLIGYLVLYRIALKKK